MSVVRSVSAYLPYPDDGIVQDPKHSSDRCCTVGARAWPLTIYGAFDMPSIEENRARVQEGLNKQAEELDHDAILAGLQEEIDKHNRATNDLRRSSRERNYKRFRERSADLGERPPTRFRFKDGVKELKRVRSRHHGDERGNHRKRRKHDYPTPPGDEEAAHPFPREPVEPTRAGQPSTDHAFRESLFDALADDEGADYWSEVYGQPIHTYERPTVRTEKGELEQMSDQQYAEYVKAKMWEKKHPEIVLERERKARKQQEEDELKQRRKESFMRDRQKEAWQRSQKAGPNNSDEDRYEFEVPKATWQGADDRARERERLWKVAWDNYLGAWDELKRQLLAESSSDETSTKLKPSARIPWPVLERKPAVKANIDAFMQHIPGNDREAQLKALKAERVRWHPDKMQQRFSGRVDEGTMMLVTGVFHVVDALMDEWRKIS